MVEFLSFLTFQTSLIQYVLKRSGIMLYILNNVLTLETGHTKFAVSRHAFGSQANVHKMSDRTLVLLRRMLQSMNSRVFYANERKFSCKYNKYWFCFLLLALWLAVCVFVSNISIKWKWNAGCTWIDFHPLFCFWSATNLFFIYLSGKRCRVTSICRNFSILC